jgi:hypothetical protein
MSSFAIKIDPPIGMAREPATQAWINAIDWDDVRSRDVPMPEYNLLFHIADQWLEFTRQSLAGVMQNLVDMHIGIFRDRESMVVIEGVDVIMARRFDTVVQFAELIDWERSPIEMPDELSPEPVGEPIPCEVVDLALRDAIAAVWQKLNVTFARH